MFLVFWLRHSVSEVASPLNPVTPLPGGKGLREAVPEGVWDSLAQPVALVTEEHIFN